MPSGKTNCLTSLPRIRGAAIMHQSEKWLLFSSYVKLPLPTSSISGSFQPPGEAYFHSLTLTSYIARIDAQNGFISGVVLHKFPAEPPHIHGILKPHSQIEKTIGFSSVPFFSAISLLACFRHLPMCLYCSAELSITEPTGLYIFMTFLPFLSFTFIWCLPTA